MNDLTTALLNYTNNRKRSESTADCPQRPESEDISQDLEEPDLVLSRSLTLKLNTILT